MRLLTPFKFSAFNLFLCLLCPPAKAVEANDTEACDRVVITTSMNEIQSDENAIAWDMHQFSDPTKHSSGKYRYIVHAVDDLWAGLLKNNFTDILAKDPFRITENPMISASVIDEVSHATRGPSGFILKVPFQNIYATGSTDVFSIQKVDENGNPVVVYYSADGKTILSPRQLLDNTTSDSYNEVVIAGTKPNGSQISVIGIYLIRSQIASKASALREMDLRETAQRLRLPVVEID